MEGDDTVGVMTAAPDACRNLMKFLSYEDQETVFDDWRIEMNAIRR